MTPIAVPSEIARLAREGAWFAYSLSGGKDGNIAAIATDAYLDSVGHPRERRVIVHADLGIIEWQDSHVMCEEVAGRLDLPLMVVKNKRYDMIGCWERRWELAVERYRTLETVTLVGPWSSSSQRFCTSRMKQETISAALVALAGKNATIVSVIGIRGQESLRRSLQPVYESDKALFRKKRGLVGFAYRPIHGWTLEDVWQAHDEAGLRRHEAYTEYDATRVSCAYCVLARESDLRAGTRNPANIPAYRRTVDLEIVSAFSFQSARWLGDMAPAALTPEQRDGLAIGKARRAARVKLESQLPKELLYVKGWPRFVPDADQCRLIAEMRQGVCALYGFDFPYTTPDAIQARYTALYEAKAAKDAEKASKGKRKRLEALESPLALAV